MTQWLPGRSRNGRNVTDHPGREPTVLPDESDDPRVDLFSRLSHGTNLARLTTTLAP